MFFDASEVKNPNFAIKHLSDASKLIQKLGALCLQQIAKICGSSRGVERCHMIFSALIPVHCVVV